MLLCECFGPSLWLVVMLVSQGLQLLLTTVVVTILYQQNAQCINIEKYKNCLEVIH